jgi:succinyl-diaminopimelate desuccinylase
VVKDGKIFGLGSADVKLDFLCKLKAVEKFRERKLKMPIYLVGTCGEEVGMFGAKYLIKSMSLNPKFVVVGEPSDLKVVYAHKCLNMFKISVDYQLVERDARGFNRRIELFSLGESAHGSYPHLGRNAILQGIEFLQGAENSGFELRFTGLDGGDSKNKVPDKAKFEFFLSSHQFEDFKRYFRERVQSKQLERAFRLEFGGLGDTGVRFLPDVLFPCVSEVVKFFKELSAEFEKTRDESYNPPSSTINLALIQQRPSGMDLFFDLRLLPDLPADEAQEKIAAGIQKIALKFPMLNVASVRERMNPPLNLTLEHELVQHCKEAMIGAGIPPIFDKKATSTEAAQYFNAGYEAIVFGPGKSMGNSHSPNEHNLIEHLEKAVLFYRKLIERICT